MQPTGHEWRIWRLGRNQSFATTGKSPHLVVKIGGAFDASDTDAHVRGFQAGKPLGPYLEKSMKMLFSLLTFF